MFRHGPLFSKSFVYYSLAMSGRAEDWRVESQGKEIRRLEKRLYEAEGKIRDLERRPREWLLKAEMALLYLLLLAIWVWAIVEIAARG